MQFHTEKQIAESKKGMKHERHYKNLYGRHLRFVSTHATRRNRMHGQLVSHKKTA